MGATVYPVGLTVLSDPEDAVADIVFVHGLQGHPRDSWTWSPRKKSRLSPSENALKDRNRRSSPFLSLSLDRKSSKGKKIEAEGSREARDGNTGVEAEAERSDGEGIIDAAAKGIFWPEDLLKPDFPEARIMTFGYNTNISQGYEAVNQGNIFSHAKNLLYELERKRRPAASRRLIFIAHSLGGILVKEVLRRSEVDRDENIKKISKATTGIFFFGTPHRGSKDWGSFGKGVTAVAGQLLRMDVNRQIIQALIGGPELELCRESFMAFWVERGTSLTVRTFQESKGIAGIGLGGFNNLIVPPDSSTLDLPSERARTLDANHIDMVRFSGKYHEGYEMVKDDVKELMLQAEEISARHDVLDLNPDEKKCLQALRTSDYEDFKDRNPNRLAATCQWVLHHKSFQDWRESSASGLLWVSADPGCGKSVLSKSLVDDDLKSTEYRTTCYFFWKDDNDIQKTITSAFSAILHQLFSQKPILIEHAMSDFTTDGYRLPGSFHKLWAILTKAASDPNAGTVVCVLDALDECVETDRYRLIDTLSAFYDQPISRNSSCQLKFLITSRPYIDIERRFADLIRNFPTIRLHGENDLASEIISGEINMVIKSKVLELGRELELDDSERSTLEAELLGMEHRTYLWLKLIVEVVRKEIGATKKKLRQIISTLPATLDEVYEAILSKSKDQVRARKLLHIIVAATRPLTLTEINIALAIETHHQSYDDLDLENEARLRSSVRNLCGLFVTVLDQKVYLIHQTAKEFLIANTPVLTGQWKHSLDPVESDHCMATACIAYLMLDILQDTIDSQTAKQYSFFSYAAIFWATHFRQSQSRAARELLQSVLQICNPQSRRFRNWFHNHFPDNENFGNTLMVASYFGHDTIVKLLLELGVIDLNAKNKDGLTPLFWGARKGHEAVVKLLATGPEVDVDMKDIRGRTPLSHAAEFGHKAVIKLLLATGQVEVDVEDNFRRTPLSYAAENGHDTVVKLLLGTGRVNVDIKDTLYGQTPLSQAAVNGHEAVVKLLLATGKVDVNKKDGFHGQTPLLHAARDGHEAVVKLLLATGPEVDVDMKDIKHGQTPLSHAAEFGHEAVVKLLLATGQVDVNSIDSIGSWTPMTYAACSGHTAVIKLLLATGQVDVNIKDADGRTPLLYAAEGGHEAAVKLLLATDQVDVDVEDKFGGTPLLLAAENGYDAIVKLLEHVPSL